MYRNVFRDTFQWVPSIVHFGVNGASFVTSPPGYALLKHSELFKLLAQMLDRFVGPFQELGALPSPLPAKGVYREIIVKAQEYEIPPGVQYSGKWHCEGKTENIQTVGVYYVDIGNDLEGGNLEFSPKVVPSGYVPLEETRLELKVQPGSAFAFGNDQLVHCATPISNVSSQRQSRLFVNFFMVDPRAPIAPKASYNTVWRILRKRLPDTLVNAILEYTGYPRRPKKFRRDVKRDMQRVAGTWNDMHYGNAGEIRFIKDFRNYRAEAKDWTQ